MKNKMYYYNYIIINLLNGRYYIGKHITHDLNDGYMGSGTAIKAAIEKYGLENFKKIIINFCDSEAEAYAYEKIMIKDWMITNKKCYNLCGGGLTGCIGYKHTEESLQKMSAVHKGKHLSEEHKMHLSKSKKGRVESTETRQKKKDFWTVEMRQIVSERFKGRPKSEETKQKMRDSFSEEKRKEISKRFKGKHLSEEQKQKMSKSQKGRPQIKFKWIDLEGNIHLMDKGNAQKWHPDWKIIEENYEQDN